jgi:beta-glucanase (GH16 family)
MQNKDIQTGKYGWKLVWNDEFDGTDIDLSKWDYHIDGHGWGNNEWQYYTNNSNNSFLQDGKLIIKAIKEEYEGSSYTSAKLVTQGLAEWTYGRFEIRAKLPIGQGMWPAFWMMPNDLEKYGDWPACGEIDIMEYLGQEPNKVYGTLHMGNPHYYIGGDIVLENGTFHDDFHVFAVEWTPTELRWYVDDNMYYSMTDWYTRETSNDEKVPSPAPFDRPFFMQLNLAVGGNWPGYPDETTVFPQTFEIDYVRVYQPADGKYNLRPPQP